MQIAGIALEVVNHVTHSLRVARALQNEPSLPLHRVKRVPYLKHVDGLVIYQIHAIGIGSKYLHNVLTAQKGELVADVTMIVYGIMKAIEYSNAFANYVDEYLAG